MAETPDPTGPTRSHAPPTPDAPHPGHRRGPSSLTRILVLVAAAALVALAATSAILADGDPEPAAPAGGDELDGGEDPGDVEAAGEDQPTELHAELFADRRADDPRALGDPDAPVVMIEWGDFQCGFCGRYARETEPELIRRYVETGVLRIEWRDLPMQGDGAWIAAMAGRAAAEQDAFWQLHERFYAEGTASSDVALTPEGLEAVARELDLDVTAFLDDVSDPANQQSISEEAQVAQALGITGTPAFLVDTQPIIGAQPLEVFVDVIESAARAHGVALP